MRVPVAKMHILRRIDGVTRKDRIRNIRNEHIGGNFHVALIKWKPKNATYNDKSTYTRPEQPF